jgi:hypothetical protein
MLTTSSMLEVYDAWDDITNVSTSYNNKPVNYTSLCLKIDGQCQKSTLLAFWNYNRTLIESQSDSQLWQTLEDANFLAVEQDGLQINLSTVRFASGLRFACA